MSPEFEQLVTVLHVAERWSAIMGIRPHTFAILAMACGNYVTHEPPRYAP